MGLRYKILFGPDRLQLDDAEFNNEFIGIDFLMYIFLAWLIQGVICPFGRNHRVLEPRKVAVAGNVNGTPLT